jgi:hypothetical protein
VVRNLRDDILVRNLRDDILKRNLRDDILVRSLHDVVRKLRGIILVRIVSYLAAVNSTNSFVFLA